jgi:hypothetical protein
MTQLITAAIESMEYAKQCMNIREAASAIRHVSKTSAVSASLWERTDQPARHDMDGFQAA